VPDHDPDPDAVPSGPTGPEAESPSPSPPVSDHDPSGLETARALASGLRGQAVRRTTTRRQARSEQSEQLSGAHPDARDPGLIGSAVEKLVTESGWATDLAVHGVFGRWDQIVGGEVAGHCTPESFADGHLTVRTDSTAWATQLKLLAPTVVRRLNQELGHGTVLNIDVVGPAAPSWRRGRRTLRGGRGPRDTYG
jgi:predicted nucleic acid-binding Zn ribbon protein